MTDRRRGLSLGEAIGILVAAIGIVTGLVSGSIRVSILVVFCFGILWLTLYIISLLQVPRAVARRLFNRCLRKWDQNRFRAFYSDIYPNEDPALTVRSVGSVLLHPENRQMEVNHTGNPMLQWDDLRCVVRRGFRFKRLDCQVLRDTLRHGSVAAVFPEHLIDRSDGFPRIVQGVFIVRWKSSQITKRCRSVVRSTENSLLPHPVLRLRQRYRAWIEELREDRGSTG